MTDAMETVRAARASDKLSAHYLRAHLFSDFVELYGDRQGGDDPAIVGGIGLFAGQAVTVITTSRGHKLEERQSQPATGRLPAWLKTRPVSSGQSSFLLTRPGLFLEKTLNMPARGRRLPSA